MKIAILGAGNIGLALAKGLAASGKFKPGNITLTRRNTNSLLYLKEKGFAVTENNKTAVRQNEIIIITVLPQQVNDLLDKVKGEFDVKKHLIISVVSGVSIATLKNKTGGKIPVIRAMPNTAIALGQSMTCLAGDAISAKYMEKGKAIFDTVGRTMKIKEELMTSATALCACGIAFFLRAIRAASQGGIEIGFHADEALKMSAQTAKGAASLLIQGGAHPENEIDKVTTPQGCTISGLNEMEHFGFSSAMIKGIKLSASKAAALYTGREPHQK
ncbi:MAG: pyrroline-5-carboxylate reductase [Bacteroidetes bacterium]|nr:pyrroline-5-carboxylate reductase [Bacteroidota bacterium]